MEVHEGAEIHLKPMEDPMAEKVDMPEGGSDPMGSPYWLCLFLEDCTLWDRPVLEQSMKRGSLQGGLT